MDPQPQDADLIAEVEAVRARLLALDPGADSSFRDRVAAELEVLLTSLQESRRDLDELVENDPPG